MSEHTPGPWRYNLYTNGEIVAPQERGPDVVVVQADSANVFDSRLIAASPEMLEMLEEIALEIRRGQDIYDWYSEIADTIEKAKGE